MKYQNSKYYFSLFYAIAFLLHCIFLSMNAIQLHYISFDINISTAQAGYITSVYFFGLIIGQIPVGIFLDKKQTKHVFSLFFAITAIGLLIIAFSNSVWLLIFGRFLMGLGASASLLSALKANSENFSNEKLSFINGITLFIGGFGVLLAGKPLNIFLEYFSWRVLSLTLCAICGIIILAIQIFSLSTKKYEEQKNITTQTFEIFALLADKKILFFCILLVIPYGFYMSILTLWISPWLKNINSMDVNNISLSISLFSLGCIFGPLLMGWLGNIVKIKNIVKLILFSNIAMILVQIVILTGFLHTHDIILWLIFSLLGQSGTLGFTYICTTVEEKYIGRAITLLNLLMFFSAFIFQSAYGIIVHLFEKQYSIILSLEIAFGIFIVLQLSSVVFYAFSKACAQNSTV